MLFQDAFSADNEDAIYKLHIYTFIYTSYIYFLTVLHIDDHQSLSGIQPVITYQ